MHMTLLSLFGSRLRIFDLCQHGTNDGLMYVVEDKLLASLPLDPSRITLTRTDVLGKGCLNRLSASSRDTSGFFSKDLSPQLPEATTTDPRLFRSEIAQDPLHVEVHVIDGQDPLLEHDHHDHSS